MLQRENIIHVIQGQFHVTDQPNDVLSTVLGSCVAACLHDPMSRIGGMNHFLLPGSDPNDGNNVKYGAHSMEQLINTMLRKGAIRSRIEVQLYGAGNVMKGLNRIGDANATFARDFVRNEGLRLTKSDLGGPSGRRVKFTPTTGAAQVNALPMVEDPAPRPVRTPRRAAPVGDVELF